MNVLFDFFILGYLSESSIAKDNRSTEGIQGIHYYYFAACAFVYCSKVHC